MGSCADTYQYMAHQRDTNVRWDDKPLNDEVNQNATGQLRVPVSKTHGWTGMRPLHAPVLGGRVLHHHLICYVPKLVDATGGAGNAALQKAVQHLLVPGLHQTASVYHAQGGTQPCCDTGWWRAANWLRGASGEMCCQCQ